jgi:ribonuclease III
MKDYEFRNVDLLNEALTHPSFQSNKQHPANNERLEFLGDRVLNLAISEILFFKHRQANEGHLALMQANLVNTKCVAEVAIEIGLDKFIKLDNGQEASGGRKNPRNLENTMEALLAAIYLDSDYQTVAKLIGSWWSKHINLGNLLISKDSKSNLQEWAQKRQLPIPTYKVLKQDGPAHQPTFLVSVSLQGFDEVIATGASKKTAELEAAAKLLKILNNYHE